MIRINRNRIYLTRGDSASFTIELEDDCGNQYFLEDGDELVFTLKKSVMDKEFIIQKRVMDYEFKLYPEETTGLTYGNYYYDIQLTKINGDVCTVVTPTLLEICPEVTFNE